MKKVKNSYKKSGVNISLANKLVKHISKLTKKNDKKTDNKFNKEINLSNYSKGMYFLEITTKSQTLHKKIILE